MLSTQKTEAARLTRSLTGKALTALRHQYHAAARRVLFLDYDGTLVPFASTPSQARPDAELLEILSRLSADPLNDVVILSGRLRRELEEFFGGLSISMVAEHGAWLRRKGSEWRMLKTMTADWKDRVRPILQLYVDRLPGALLEEKEYSLAWHYRRADPEQAPVRAKELLDDLADYTRNIDLQVLEGKKVLEVRNSGVNKGAAALQWLTESAPDFILSIGDDWTDEDVFRALPPTAWSVRVGVAKTDASFFLTTHTEVRRVLGELMTSTREQPEGLKIVQPRTRMEAAAESIKPR